MIIADICHYYTSPPRSGGQKRISSLNSGLSKKHKVFQFSITAALREKEHLRHNDNYSEQIYPFFRYQGAAFFLYRLMHLPYDYLIPDLFRNQVLPSEMKQCIDKSDIVLIEHPWLFPWVHQYTPKPIILAAHNVEYDLQGDGFKNRTFRDHVLKRVFDTEGYAVKNADHVTAVCDSDRKRLSELYCVSPLKISVVPNGVDKSFFSLPSKGAARKMLGLKDEQIVLFAGAGHPPNEKALGIIEKQIAPRMKDTLFVIAGSVCSKMKIRNILCTGPADDLRLYFAASDIAINPMLSGSGTNIKMLEYMAAGLPVVTTEIGRRGLPQQHQMILCDINEFPSLLEKLFKDRRLSEELGKRGRSYAREYAWDAIAEGLADTIKNAKVNSQPQGPIVAPGCC